MIAAHEAAERLIMNLRVRALPFFLVACLAFSVGMAATPQDRNSASIVPFASQQLSWSSSGQVGSFDLFLGTSSPPRLAVTGITGTTYTADNLTPGTTYYWYVVAHASCDNARTSQSVIKSFTTAGSCAGAGSFALSSPGNQQLGVGVSPTLSWSVSSNAVAYDVYLGSSSNPPLYQSGVLASSLEIPKLTPATTYYWKVVAISACDPSKNVSSAVQSFTVGTSCGSPTAPAIRFAPSTVSASQTYVVSWSDAENLDPAGSYIVERSTDSGFGSVLDKQQTTATSASFVAGTAGTAYHRVRAVSGCTGGASSGNSDVKSVTINAATPSVIFTIQPRTIITKLGDKLEDLRGNFTMENIGEQTVQVIVGHQDVNGSVPFFQIIDPFGGDGTFVTLDPHKPKNMDLHFSGPPNDQGGSFEGIIYLVSSGEQFAVNPSVYVNLKVGGDATAAAPKFLVGGVESDYAWFPPLDGDDSSRQPISVDILNSGTVLMEVGGEIGPEEWLKTDKDWNKTAIPASSFRTIRLYTQRNRAPNGSALPRYTYLTIRNKAGQSARLLIQDNGGAAVSKGRSALPRTGERSYIVPFVTTSAPLGARTFSKVRLANVGSDAVQVELVYTPADTDGFDANAIQRVTIVAPPNDVVNLTDPLGEIFGITSAQTGALEVRAAQEKIGSLTVTSSIYKQLSGGGGYGTTVPVVARASGAYNGAPQTIVGVRSASDAKTQLFLAETTGREKTSVRVTLYDTSGNALGNQLIEVPRYGFKQIADVAQTLGGGASLDTGRVDLSVEQGGGAVVGLARVADPQSDSGTMIASRYSTANTSPSPLGRPGLYDKSQAMAATGAMTYYIPGVVNGDAPLSSQSSATNKTRLALTGATDATTSFKVSFTDKNGQSYSQDVPVAAKQTVEYANVVEDLFKVAAGTKTEGVLRIDTDAKGLATARVTAKLSAGGVGDALPTLTAFDEALTGGGSTKLLYADCIEQSTDTAKGTRSSLTLTEISGRGATVNVMLYEAGNRSLPIAQKDFTLNANQQTTLDTLFSALGLDSDDRRKDRTNVQVAVSAKSGAGLVSALLTTIDNKTGETKKTLLMPTGGTFGSIGSAPSSSPVRRRPVRPR
jgi:hypothetical protein